MIHEENCSIRRDEIIMRNICEYYNYSAQSATLLPPRGRAPSNAAVKSDASHQPLRTSGYAPCRVRLADPRREYLVMFTRPTRLSGRTSHRRVYTSVFSRTNRYEKATSRGGSILICHDEYLTTSCSPRAFSTLHYVTFARTPITNAIRRAKSESGELW